MCLHLANAEVTGDGLQAKREIIVSHGKMIFFSFDLHTKEDQYFFYSLIYSLT